LHEVPTGFAVCAR